MRTLKLLLSGRRQDREKDIALREKASSLFRSSESKSPVHQALQWLGFWQLSAGMNSRLRIHRHDNPADSQLIRLTILVDIRSTSVETLCSLSISTALLTIETTTSVGLWDRMQTLPCLSYHIPSCYPIIRSCSYCLGTPLVGMVLVSRLHRPCQPDSM